jgi:glycosyltransferase involved in cell wall biosynthesis
MRAHHLIAGLLDAGHEVVVVALPQDADHEAPDRPRLTVLGAAVRRRTGWRRWSALVSPYPEEVWARPPSALHSLDLDIHALDVVLSFDSRSSRPALHLREKGIPTVIDEFNVEFRLARDIAATAPTARGRIRGRIDSLKTRAFEASALRRCDLVTSVSDDDARVLRTLAAPTPVEVHPSGADVAGITAVDHRKNRGDRLVLTGTLGYLPNIDAARYLGAEILPHVRAVRPSVRAHLVGQVDDPVRAMIVADGVDVIGWVPDVLPHLADGDLFVAPLRVGGGTRLKILEAFAAGLPVVATTKAVEGLEVENGVHALLADDAAGLARAILALMDDEDGRERLALAARRLVEEKYDWRRIGAKFAESVERVAKGGIADHRDSTGALPGLDQTGRQS